MLVKIKVLFLNCESVNTTVFENNFIHELNLCLRKVSGTFARQLTDLISFGPNSVVFSRRDLINSSFTFSLHLPPALAISLSLPRSFSFSLLFCPLTVSSFFLFFLTLLFRQFCVHSILYLCLSLVSPQSVHKQTFEAVPDTLSSAALMRCVKGDSSFQPL